MLTELLKAGFFVGIVALVIFHHELAAVWLLFAYCLISFFAPVFRGKRWGGGPFYTPNAGLLWLMMAILVFAMNREKIGL